jgi:hypothetical protein
MDAGVWRSLQFQGCNNIHAHHHHHHHRLKIWVIGLTMMRTKLKLSLILTFLHSQIGRLGFEAQGGEEVSVLASS